LLNASTNWTAAGAVAPTQLPSSMQRIVSPRASPGVSAPTISPRLSLIEPTHHPHHLIRPLPFETAPDHGTSTSHYNISRCNTPLDSSPGSLACTQRATALLSVGASATSSVAADIASLDGAVSWMGLPGSPMAGLSPRLSLQGSTESLRGHSRRSGEDGSTLAGYASLLNVQLSPVPGSRLASSKVQCVVDCCANPVGLAYRSCYVQRAWRCRDGYR
jgi:hypothetical protein